jgi:nucleoside-diphosphate-sugar epimerase
LTVLISGSTGFVGRNLSEYLLLHMPGISLISLVRQKTGKGTEILWQNLSPEDLCSVDAVVHLAGRAHDLKKVSNDEEYFEVNYGLTKKLCDAFLPGRAKKFIYISSVKAAADVAEGELTEEVLPQPITAYGRSKLKAEEYIQSSVGADKQYYILRPCMIHGPGNKGNLNLLYQFAKSGIPYPLAAFDNQRSFLSIENLCFTIWELLERPIPSGVYNVADDEPTSTTELIKTIAAVQGSRAKLWRIPKNIIKAVAKAGDVIKFPLNSERLKKLTESYVVSNEKIKAALGIKRMPVKALDGLVETLKSFK